MRDGRDRRRVHQPGRPHGWVVGAIALAIVLGAVTTASVPAAQGASHRSGAAVRVGPATSEDACNSDPVHGYGFDRYGGWKGLRREATGRFTVRRVGRGFSLFTPLGHAFFANGASGIEPIGDRIGTTSRSPYHEAILAKHGSEAAWADATFARLCDIGMRTMGGWVGAPDVERFAGRLAYTVNVDIYATLPEVTTAPGGIKARRDVFVADALERARAAVSSNPLVVRCTDDPWCIGVYVENEQSYAPAVYSGGSHVDVYLSQPAGAPGKRGLQQFFMRRYDDDVAAFNDVWGTNLRRWSAFQQLEALGDCAPDPGWADDLCVITNEDRRRIDDRLAFEALVARRNARVADRVLDELQPAMLNLGPRLVIAPYSPQLLRAISAPADILSVNNYDVGAIADLILTPEVRAAMAELGLLSFDPFERLHRIARITRKPLWVSEWFYRQARPDVASFPPLLPERPDAETRADAVGTYLDALLDMPFVVGESWFQWQDQPIEGRFDGENQLIGVVDIGDELNEPLATTLAERYAQIVDRRFTDAATLPRLEGFYPRVIRLEHAGARTGELLAVTTYRDRAGLWRSTDEGRTFAFAGVIEVTDGAIHTCCQELFEMPTQLGPYPAGTLLWAGSTRVSDDPRRMELRVFRSDDHGATWHPMTPCTVSTGATAPGGLWEPAFHVADDGSLVCLFSDETAQPTHSQYLAQTISTDGGQTWSAKQPVVQLPVGFARPGMGTTVRLPDGTWLMTYEICAWLPSCSIYLKRSADGRNWGDPAEIGTAVTTADGSLLSHTPVLSWIDTGSASGRVVLSGQLFQNADWSIARGNGATLLVSDDAGETWRAARAPIAVPDAYDNFCPNYSSPVLPLDGAGTVLEMASVWRGSTCLTVYERGVVR